MIFFNGHQPDCFFFSFIFFFYLLFTCYYPGHRRDPLLCRRRVNWRCFQCAYKDKHRTATTAADCILRTNISRDATIEYRISHRILRDPKIQMLLFIARTLFEFVQPDYWISRVCVYSNDYRMLQFCVSQPPESNEYRDTRRNFDRKKNNKFHVCTDNRQFIIMRLIFFFFFVKSIDEFQIAVM